jgi:hypothetical protein
MPNLSDTPGVVEVELEAAVAPVNIQGRVANLLTYNGAFPAPTICGKKGDLLRVHFKNSLQMTNETNILGYQKNITNPHCNVKLRNRRLLVTTKIELKAMAPAASMGFR